MELLGVAFLQLSASAGPQEFAPVLQGLTLAVLMFITGHISGGHLNPLISLSTAALGYHPLLHSLMYLVMQFLGALLGAFATRSLLPQAEATAFLPGDGPGCLDNSVIPPERLGHDQRYFFIVNLLEM